jgi:hypothetical protein
MTDMETVSFFHVVILGAQTELVKGMTLFHLVFLVLSIGRAKDYQLHNEPAPGDVIDLVFDSVCKHPDL